MDRSPFIKGKLRKKQSKATMAALKPPFTATTAREKVKFAQGMWNTRDPSQVAKGYTADCIWRNRDQFIQGTAAIVALLTAKWTNEQDYRLRKELFAVGGDRGERIAVQFWYEYRDRGEGGRWKRCYGLEDWTFDVSFTVRFGRGFWVGVGEGGKGGGLFWFRAC